MEEKKNDCKNYILNRYKELRELGEKDLVANELADMYKLFYPQLLS